MSALGWVALGGMGLVLALAADALRAVRAHRRRLADVAAIRTAMGTPAGQFIDASLLRPLGLLSKNLSPDPREVAIDRCAGQAMRRRLLRDPWLPSPVTRGTATFKACERIRLWSWRMGRAAAVARRYGW